MEGRIHYTLCPVCNSPAIDPLLTLKDYSVSGETFVVWQCASCHLRFTQDVPDASDIEPYYRSDAYISHSNDAKGFINKTYQRVRTFTLTLKKRMLVRYTGKKKGRLLDFGAGTGAFLQSIQREGWTVTGIEPDEGARNIARNSFGQQLEAPALLQNLPTQSFDAITLWHVLEHVHDLHPTIEMLHGLLKEDGKMFIAVPNYTSLDASLYRLAWAAYDVPRHLYHFAPESMRRLVQQHGLVVEAIQPMWFDAFYISLLSSKYKNGKAFLPGAFITGLRSNIHALFNPERCSSLVYIVRKA